jgi:hypothetical protein
MTARIDGVLAQEGSKETGWHTGMGMVNGQKVKVLRDTGATCCIINARWVRAEQYTGNEEPCVMVDGSLKYYPTASIRVQTEFFRGTTKALVMREPMYDVIIGNILGASLGPRRAPVLGEQKRGERVGVDRRTGLSRQPTVKPHWSQVGANWRRYKELSSARGHIYTRRGKEQVYRTPVPRGKLAVDPVGAMRDDRHVDCSGSINDQGSIRQRHGRRSEIGQAAHFVPRGGGTHVIELERGDCGEGERRQKRAAMMRNEKRVRERRRKERARRRREEERRRGDGRDSGRV